MSAASGAGDSVEWPVERVRAEFIKFFEDREHRHFRSSPVVPHDDPTLLFANAGMNQFKPIFLGRADPSGPLAGLQRAANSQKCIRAGGKHNDLDDVGKDTYHHTFFEMLGNWSFGDYFKEESIRWAWELLTEVYKLDKDRLYATYFEGDDDVPADTFSRDLWISIIGDESRVIASNKADNFWEMGDTGPCGPCTEIHYDRIGGRNCHELVNKDDPNVIEIWNLVFMQFFRGADGNLTTLPAQHVDTGMGLERVTSILQGKPSNYDTDVFMPIFAAIQAETGAEPYTGKLGAEDEGNKDMAYRVVADHIRTLSFAITDGAVPSNEGRGYVLRRVLRRAVRYGKEILNAGPGFMQRLVPVLVEHMKGAFPELEGKAAFVQEVLDDEEMAFRRTLDKGVKRFRGIADKLKEEGSGVVSGEDAFFLYDSMGFPVDLTQLMAEERGLTVDVEGFAAAMEAQKERSRQASKFKSGGDAIVLQPAHTAALQEKELPVTQDDAKYTWYKYPNARVLAMFNKDGMLEEGAEATAESGTVGLVLDATSFYAESGGQETDYGKLRVVATGEDAAAAGGGAAADEDDEVADVDASAVLEVGDCRAFAGFVLHCGSVAKGALRVGDVVQCAVDYERRSDLAPNHTMTHVLNYALRSVLGGDVDQRGSLVAADKLRFDFSFNKALTPDQVVAVERIVNEQIDRSMPVYTQVTPLAEARQISSLRAVFGETYPDPVRVVSVGQSIPEMVADPENEAWGAFSVEFCGGTHLTKTSQARRFCIASESGIAKGVRRIEGLTRQAAIDAEDRAEELRSKYAELNSVAKWEELQQQLEAVKTERDEAVIPQTVRTQLLGLDKVLGKKIAAGKKQAAAAAKAAIAKAAVEAAAAAKAAGKAWAVVRDDAFEGKAARPAVDALKKAKADSAVLFVSAPGKRFAVHAYASAAAQEAGLSASEWVAAAVAPLENPKLKARGDATVAVAQGPDANDAAAGCVGAAEAFAEGKIAGGAAAAGGGADA